MSYVYTLRHVFLSNDVIVNMTSYSARHRDVFFQIIGKHQNVLTPKSELSVQFKVVKHFEWVCSVSENPISPQQTASPKLHDHERRHVLSG